MPDIPGLTMTLRYNHGTERTGDNGAVMLGFSVHKLIDIGGSEFAALCHPDTDFDGRFKCFDTDNQEWLIVNGWLADSITDAH